MKTNKQLLVIALGSLLIASTSLVHASSRVSSDSVTFAKPEAKKPAPKKETPAKKETSENAAASPENNYDKCLSLLESDPNDALDYAQAWQISTEQVSLAARHCAALAMSALGRYRDSAILLSEVAIAMDNKPKEVPKETRAEAFAQVANAWTLAKDNEKALTAINQALALDPSADYVMMRANIHALAKNWDAVRIDTGKVLAELPTDADALTLRATAYRNLGAVQAALEDANRAIEIAPHNLTALLERGRIKAALHDMAGARADWQQVVTYAKQTGQEKDAQAVAAQEFLEMDDAGADAAGK